MPLIGTRGAASSRGFGQFGGVESAPFIVLVSSFSNLYGAQLFEDGSMLVSANSGGSTSNWTVLSTGAHTPGSSRQINAFSDFYATQSSPTSSSGALAYNEAFARVANTNTTLAAKIVQGSFGWGGSPGASTAYVSSTGDTFLANGLYATSGATATTAHIVKIDSSGSVVANRNMSTDPSYNSTGTVYSCAADTGSAYVATSEGIWRLPASLVSATLYIPLLYNNLGIISNVTIDNSGNIYFMSRDATNGGTTLFKYSSGFGTKLFAVCLSGVLLNTSYTGSVAIDPITQEPYWLIGTSIGTARIIKTSTSLVPQFAREISLSGSVSPTGWKDLQVVGNLMAFRNQAAKMAFVLPKDGSKTGTYSISGVTVAYSSVALPSYSSVGSDWAVFSATYSTTRSFAIGNASITTGTAFTVSSINL